MNQKCTLKSFQSHVVKANLAKSFTKKRLIKLNHWLNHQFHVYIKEPFFTPRGLGHQILPPSILHVLKKKQGDLPVTLPLKYRKIFE